MESPEYDKYKKALDAICKTWSEVKLLQMKASDVESYMNKNKSPKGDNTVSDPLVHQSHVLALEDPLGNQQRQCLLD